MYMFTAKSVVVSGIRWRSIGRYIRYPLPHPHFINYQPQNSKMYRSAAKSVVVWRSIGHYTPYLLHRPHLINYKQQNSQMYRPAAISVVVSGIRWRSIFYPPSLNRKQMYCFEDIKALTTNMSATKKSKTFNDKDYPHVKWWKEQMHKCRKTTSMQLINRLAYSNLLGLDDNLKNGSIKEGTHNCEILKFKSKFPREVFLCRVGEFYEAVGFDACILVEYAGLKPSSALRSDGVPKVYCHIMNLRQTLDDLIRNGFSVCIVEEIQGPTLVRSRKDRFISGHAHPGSPYVFGHVEDDHDLEFPEPMPVVGLSRSVKGYCIVSVLETMKTYTLEDGLTEEAVATKLRTCHYHHLFLHESLMNDSSGTTHWTKVDEGGLLWGECNGRYFEWINGDIVYEILDKVKELYGLDDDVTFRNVTVASENKPHPLHLGTASQTGVIPTEGVPHLLKVLLPSDCTGLPATYIRDLLLNPPSYAIASDIQATCNYMSAISCPIPDFTYIVPSKLVKLLELKEANHVEFRKIKKMLDQILKLYRNSELYEILQLLLDPTRVASGLKINLESLVKKCEFISCRIGDVICLNGESDQKLSSYVNVPSEFFEVMEQSWKNRVKHIHLKEAYEEVDKAAGALSLAVTDDFLPVICRIRASPTDFVLGAKGEILYAREHKAIWFKGKHFHPTCSKPGEKEIKKLQPCVDSKGRKVGGEWFTTKKVQDALTRYHEANAKAKSMVLEVLRGLSAELQAEINILVFASMLLVIAKALFAHVGEGLRRKWVFPTLIKSQCSEDKEEMNRNREMMICGLSPYWFDTAEGSAVLNDVNMKSMLLVTGPNRVGISTLLRSVAATALLGVCGLMVPAELAIIPHFDSIMLQMGSYDSSADGKGSFQIEMSEIHSIIARATPQSLVLIDEICRGVGSAKRTCIAGSLIEALDSIDCLGVVSTHLLDIFNLPLITKHLVYKVMRSDLANGIAKPTYKLIDGIYEESFAFKTTQKGLPKTIIQRAEHLYNSVYNYDNCKRFYGVYNKQAGDQVVTISSMNKSPNQMEKLWKDVENAACVICDKKLNESSNAKTTLRCVLVRPQELPPISTIGASSVYVILRPDKKLYVGETNNLLGRVRACRSKKGMRNASFMYFLVSEKSMACELETLLIYQLPKHGFKLTNVARRQH